MLYVAAHPDDENTQLITYLARGRGYRTAYLSLTRGDGGQNVIGPEFGEIDHTRVVLARFRRSRCWFPQRGVEHRPKVDGPTKQKEPKHAGEDELKDGFDRASLEPSTDLRHSELDTNTCKNVWRS